MIPHRLSLIVDHLIRTVAALIGGGVHPPRIEGHVTLLIHNRLRAVVRRFAAVAARLARGTLRPPAPRAAPTQPVIRAPAPRWPHRLRGTRAWLVRMAQDTAPFASQLAHFLADPETRALIAAAPQLRTVLRPLCRMLGVTIPPDPPPPAASDPSTSPPRLQPTPTYPRRPRLPPRSIRGFRKLA